MPSKHSYVQRANRRDPMLLVRARHARRIIRNTLPGEEERLGLLAAVVWPRDRILTGIRQEEREERDEPMGCPHCPHGFTGYCHECKLAKAREKRHAKQEATPSWAELDWRDRRDAKQMQAA
jgi:hypothetical protein